MPERFLDQEEIPSPPVEFGCERMPPGTSEPSTRRRAGRSRLLLLLFRHHSRSARMLSGQHLIESRGLLPKLRPLEHLWNLAPEFAQGIPALLLNEAHKTHLGSLSGTGMSGVFWWISTDDFTQFYLSERSPRMQHSIRMRKDKPHIWPTSKRPRSSQEAFGRLDPWGDSAQNPAHQASSACVFIRAFGPFRHPTSPTPPSNAARSCPSDTRA